MPWKPLVLVLATVLLCSVDQSSAILRGDETQKLQDELSRVRAELHSLERGTPEHTNLELHYHTLHHKTRALDFFDHGMTQPEYDEFIALVDRQKELKAAHTRDDFDPAERLEFAKVNSQVEQFLAKYKKIRQAKRHNDPESEAERKKIQALREKMTASEDRDEIEALRLELEAIYAAKPKLTSYGKKQFNKRKHREKERRQQGKKRRFPKMDKERLARVRDLRERIAETEDRDELYRLRQALKYERDEATAEEEMGRGAAHPRAAR